MKVSKYLVNSSWRFVLCYFLQGLWEMTHFKWCFLLILAFLLKQGVGLLGLKSPFTSSIRNNFRSQTQVILQELNTVLPSTKNGVITNQNNFIIDKIEKLIDLRRNEASDMSYLNKLGGEWKLLWTTEKVFQIYLLFILKSSFVGNSFLHSKWSLLFTQQQV